MSMDRRTFMQLLGAAGGGLMLGVSGGGCANPQVRKMTELAAETGEFQPNVFLTVTPDDRVLLALNKSEMGQGVMTGTATLVAEELEVPVSRIEPFHAAKPEFETSFGDANISVPGLGMQITGGSSSTPENYLRVRRAAASAREMLIAAAAASWGVPASACAARDGAVHHEASGRSTRYGELTKLAAQQPLVEEPRLKKRSEFTRIGVRRQRSDALSKVTGAAEFGTDVAIPNVARAYVLHPPTLGATVAKLDAAEAKGMTGVLDVLTFERGVAVVAEKYWQARRAAKTVQVTWRGGILNGLNTDALREAARDRVTRAGDHTMRDEGDVDDAMARDGVKALTSDYDVPYLAHAPMEPMNATVHVQAERVTVWAPNQSPTVMAEAVSRVLRVPREQVTVHSTMLGGGFGRRGVPDYVAEAALLARHFDRPIQVIWSREDDTRMAYYRPLATFRMRGAVNQGGKAVALAYRSASQSIIIDQAPVLSAAFPEWIPLVGRRMMARSNTGFLSTGSVADFIASEGATDTPYDVENIRVEYIPINTRLPVSFWRSVGHSFNGFVMESFIDELAHAAERDPVEFRRELLQGKPRYLEVLNTVARISGWGKPTEEGWGRGVAIHRSFGTIAAQVIEAGVFDDVIRVRKVWCAVDCGVAINPDVVSAQMEGGAIFGLSAALKQQINLVDGVVQEGNFDTYPSLRMHESPEIEVAIIDSDEAPTGVGEPGLPPAAPALANAIFAATGVRLRRMPFEIAWQDAKEAAP